jgi:hypothetical protein
MRGPRVSSTARARRIIGPGGRRDAVVVLSDVLIGILDEMRIVAIVALPVLILVIAAVVKYLLSER